jgi:hypothetical protein
MTQISILESIRLLFVLAFWFVGICLFFYLAWRLVKAVERIAENTKAN